MTEVDDASWIASMHDLQADLSKRAVNECNRLRLRVRELESKIAETPADYWAMQERIAQLERLLAATKENKQ